MTVSNAMFEHECLADSSPQIIQAQPVAQDSKVDSEWRKSIGNRSFSAFCSESGNLSCSSASSNGSSLSYSSLKSAVGYVVNPFPFSDPIPLGLPSKNNKENIVYRPIIQPLPEVEETKKPMGLPKPGIATETKRPAELSKGGHLADFAFETSSCFEKMIRELWRQHFQNLRQRDAEAEKEKEAAQRLTAFIRAKMEPRLEPRVLSKSQASRPAVVPVKAKEPEIGFQPKHRPSAHSSWSSSEGSYPDFKC